jgi:glycosyltransferase involved in cell wall biosynthesis
MKEDRMQLFFMIGYDLDRCPWATRPRAVLEKILQQGHQVILVDLLETDKKHLPIHPPIETSKQIQRVRLKQKYFSALDAPLALFPARRKLISLIEQSDIVHIQKPKALTWLAGRIAWKMHKPIVYDWDDLEGTGGIRTGWSARKTDRIDRFFATHSQAIVAAGAELERLIREKFQARAPVYCGPCGVDLNKFNPEKISAELQDKWKEKLEIKNEKILIYHGQLEMAGGAGLLLEALKNMKDKDWTLLLVGGGRRQQSIVRIAESIGLADRVKATGYVPFAEIPVLLSLADAALALFPDNLYARCKSPLKIYEAMAMGLPMIATRIGQPAQVLKECAKLIEPNRADLLEQEIRWILEYPEKARQLGRKARQQAEEKHSWDHLGAMFMEIYEGMRKKVLPNM